jgi:hypothetical protein
MPLAAVAGMATGQSATPNGTAASTDLKDVTARNVASVLELEAADHERRSTSDRAIRSSHTRRHRLRADVR